jgi:hypothetical protein
MQKMFVIHYRMLVTLVKMIYAVNSKIISMAMVVILKLISLLGVLPLNMGTSRKERMGK